MSVIDIARADARGIAAWLDMRPADAPPATRLQPGERLGDWRVAAFLGKGLSAEVYRVTNVRFGQEGALKLLVDPSRGLLERFQTEADALRSLTLRALPRYMGAGEHGGLPYYIMEYLRPLPDPMPRRLVPRVMVRLAKAVQCLHDAGYIHRDLKPGNVMLRGNDEPVLIDLGLIKRRGLGVVDPIVRHGRGISLIDGKPVGVGTLDYAAPEQLLKGEASVQSDVFALGKMLRALYEGHPPLCVKGVIRRATRELPGDRYQTADAFARALRHRRVPQLVTVLFLVLVVSGVALFPVLRPRIARVLLPILDPPRPVLAVTPRPDETPSAYLTRLLPLARGGDAQAQIALAEAYFYGRGTPTNRTEAVRWYRVAAASGEADAQASLGLCAFRGWGCAKDVDAAARWWTQAAAQGHLGALSDLAFCYQHGFGVPRDERKSFETAMRAAERGHAPAQTMVAECYLDGRGVEPDVERAETWLYRAARQGNRRAQMLLRTR